MRSPSSVYSPIKIQGGGESNVSMNPGVPCLGYHTLGGYEKDEFIIETANLNLSTKFHLHLCSVLISELTL